MTRGQAALDLIVLLCQGFPPPYLQEAVLESETLKGLPDATYERLQEFLLNEMVLQWSTGIGTLEAIDHMVEEAVNNSIAAFAYASPEFPDQDAFDTFVEVRADKTAKRRLRAAKRASARRSSGRA